MWRTILTLAFGALFVIGQWGARFLASSPTGRQTAMTWLHDLDSFFRGGWSPTLTIIGIVGLLTIWLLSPATRHFLDRIFGERRRAFSSQYDLEEYAANRQRFRWNLERAYRQYKQDAAAHELPNLIREIEWPADFPTQSDVLAYAQNINWPNEAGKKFWAFCTQLFDPVISVEDRNERLPEPNYSNLINGYRMSARFWDHWARQVLDGLLSPEAIRGPLEANAVDIRALAISQLAMARAIGWDRSSGKSPLFYLARDHLQIAGGPWIQKIRRWASGQLRRIAERISPDGAR